MTLTPEAHAAVEQLTVEELDTLIAITHADLTWHSEHMGRRIWQAIDQLLDRRLQLTDSHNATTKQQLNTVSQAGR